MSDTLNDLVQLTRDGPVARLAPNNPPHHVFSIDMIRLIAEAFRKLALDAVQRCGSRSGPPPACRQCELPGRQPADGDPAARAPATGLPPAPRASGLLPTRDRDWP